MTEQYPSRTLDKIVIRVPDGLRERIKLAADANSRSVNAELVQLLETTYPPEPTAEEVLRNISGFLAWAQDKKHPALRRSGLVHLLPSLKELKEVIERDLNQVEESPPQQKTPPEKTGQ